MPERERVTKSKKKTLSWTNNPLLAFWSNIDAFNANECYIFANDNNDPQKNKHDENFQAITFHLDWS